MQAWLLYAVGCLAAWGLWGFVLKLAYRGLSWAEVYLLSTTSSFALAVTVYTILTRGGLRVAWGRSAALAALAGVLGGLGYVLFVKALESGKASVVIPLTALYPAVTVVLAALLLGEELGLLKLLGIALAVIAVLLLSI